MAAKQRLDKALVEQGIAGSRERAQALILAGRVLVNEQKVDKPGAAIPEDAVLRMLGEDLRYVSRGGLKLEGALAHWQIDLKGLRCLDVGTSTGGFTDCMLQHGAASVVCVDTGYGQIAHRLRDDARVQLMERTNARKLMPGDLPAGLDFFAMDVSFIAASLILPAVIAAAFSEGMRAGKEAVILVKPQFEAGREHVGKGGIVRDSAAHLQAVDRVRQTVIANGAALTEVIESPITGVEGNREFLLYARF
jgi:23S rRNA (cytidine1920-2'-O)/16S rRNA (cytidine1409-2'-O)-methyltransferase